MKKNIEDLMLLGLSQSQAIQMLDLFKSIVIPKELDNKILEGLSFSNSIIASKLNLEVDKKHLGFTIGAPKFKNTCEKCTYLGYFRGHDLYYCMQGGFPTILARFGNDESSYVSGMQFAENDKDVHNSEMGEAYRRSVVMGLI